MTGDWVLYLDQVRMSSRCAEALRLLVVDIETGEPDSHLDWAHHVLSLYDANVPLRTCEECGELRLVEPVEVDGSNPDVRNLCVSCKQPNRWAA